MAKIHKKYQPGIPRKGQFVVYLRVSTQRQGVSGLGLQAQQDACNEFLNGGAWEIIKTFEEVESGSGKKKRPELMAALELCEETGATLLVAKIDRLARNVAFVSKLLESKVDFVAADMPVANKLTIHVIAAMAEYERDQISERTKAALAVVKKRGVKLGNPNPGEAMRLGRAERTLRANEKAEEVYTVIERIRSFGVTSLRGIAAELEDRKILTPLGKKKWGPEQVKQVIQRIINK